MDDIPGPILRAGQRVRVKVDPVDRIGPWPTEPFGTIAEHPLSEDGATWRPTRTRSGLGRLYWLVFDEPQLDPDGDGPYPNAEVLDKYLELIR